MTKTNTFSAGPSGDAVDWLAGCVLGALARGDRVGPSALLLILRCYRATGRTDCADALGPALARIAEPGALDDDTQQAAWLMLLVEAAAASDDERLRAAAAGLIGALRRGWGRSRASGPRDVEPLAWSIDACLVAASAGVLAAAQVLPPALVPEAIDELEAVIAAAYRPGAGMSGGADGTGPSGRLADQIRAASALLTAHAMTARLPYAMLAEELVQFAGRTLWDEDNGGFFEQPGVRVKPFALNCEAARVLSRLAALHSSSDYRQTAVVAPGADYRVTAGATLAALEPCYRTHGVDAAVYGLAVAEWFEGP